MARKPRIEVEGGLYHIISRGNNRQRIFNAHDDYSKFLALLETQKVKLPFFLYAYCLMPNHIHLLIERREDSISRIMQRVLTGYSQYHNRRYRRVGHVFQGRYKAILCQTDQYLAELVRYIHLNPVRAKLVQRPDQYPYSSHRCYLGQERSTLVDVDPVLRCFGSKRKLARERYHDFVRAGMKLGRQDSLYRAVEGRILGSEEFVDSTIHRIGAVKPASSRRTERRPLDPEALIRAAERASGLLRQEFCNGSKRPDLVSVKEALILVGRERGVRNSALSQLVGINESAVSRRYDTAKRRRTKAELERLVEKIEQQLE